MTARPGLVLVAVVGASCGGSSRQHVELTHLSFDVPSDWTHTETKLRGAVTSVWTPSEGNDRKESVTVIRTERSPAVARGGAAALQGLLASAQGSLQDAKISGITPMTTASGLAGVQLEADYTPPGMKATYHRVHLVLVDGSALVHVLYTARDPDAQLGALRLVLDTIRHEES